MAFSSAAFWATQKKYLMTTGIPFHPTIIASAKGTVLYDVNGDEKLDFTSGQMSTLLGHSNPEIVDVVNKWAGKLDHLSSVMISQPPVDLAKDLGRILPAPLEKSFFLSTGSESVEASIALAKCVTGKFEVVAFSASYHGVTQGSASATYSIGRKHGLPTMPGQLAFPAPNAYRSPFRKADGSYDWETEMKYAWSMIDQQSVGSLAAFVFEPILSAGGIYEPPEGYIKQLAIECRKRGMLLIADEAQTGLCRTGDMFAFQRDEIVPDILALSKTIGAGLPLASVSTTAEIARIANERRYLWITTHYNDPLPCAVGSKVIEICVRDNMAQVARDRGQQIREGLLRLREKYWCIGDIRGRGLLQGMEIVSDPVTRAYGGEIGAAASDRAMALGLSCQCIAIAGLASVFRLAPPLTVSVEEVELALEILDQSFEYVMASYAQGVQESEVATARL